MTNMKNIITLILVITQLFFVCSCSEKKRNTQLIPVVLEEEEVNFLKKDLAEKEKSYDKEKKMTWTVTSGRHYHSDLDSGVVVHETRASIEYAVELMYTREKDNISRAIDIIETVLPMQETDTAKAYCGVWPYYPEDPLNGRVAPVDYNWADFMAVPLIDIWINFRDYISCDLQNRIEKALVLAARASMKRNVKGDYTNMCIMGIYVCYIVGDLMDLPDLSTYARGKLRYFYDYTIDNKGFTEYNSPTYTIVAMNELLRMKRTIINPEDKEMVDKLYSMCWRMAARHFHQPSGQWCGPNLRAYSSLLTPDLKRLFYNASNGIVNLPGEYPRIPNVIAPHKIPDDLISLFTKQMLPRIEIDTFLIGKLQPVNQKVYDGVRILATDIIGKMYAHPHFAIASVNQGYMWNQCRPLIVHWGTQEDPTYMQVRFLHDDYDFSAVNIKCVQDSATVLSIFNIAYNGGDKHPSIDRIKDSTILAKDLRLRFEIGGNISHTEFSIIDGKQNSVLMKSRDISCFIKLPYVRWDELKGQWIVGGDKDRICADYVIYSGEKRKFDFSKMEEAVVSLYLSFSDSILKKREIRTEVDEKYLTVSTEEMQVKALKKPDEEFRIKNDYEIKY